MALDTSAISNAANTALGLSNLILVSPQSTIGYQAQNFPSWKNDSSAQPPAILFNYEAEQSVSLSSDVTDHYIEDNTAIQDQVALKPETITTSGFIGELNDVAPAALIPLQTVAEKLVAIGAYAPQISETAAIAYAKAFQLYQVGSSLANSAVSSWASLTGGGAQTVINGATTQQDITNQTNKSQTKQQIYFQQFYGYWKNRTLFTVQTPWAVFQDMIIQSLRAVQDAETRMITDFEITFKLMRFASTQSVANIGLYDSNDSQGRLLSQSSEEVDLGTSSVETSNVSFASQLA
jgi:hypothetical protein